VSGEDGSLKAIKKATLRRTKKRVSEVIKMSKNLKSFGSFKNVFINSLFSNFRM
jgi:hypothetical protein